MAAPQPLAPAAESAPLIEVVDLDFAYRHDDGWLRVLHKVNFTIGRGEAFGLVGESGCGKSTVAYQLLGYQRPNSRVEGGHIFYKGQDILALDRAGLDRLRGNRISLVPQNPTTALTPGMRVGKQIAEVLLYHKRSASAAEAAQRVAELLGLVGLPDPDRIGRRYPHQLSGGQQQRVTIAMALACDPDLVVLDEPTTGLDVTTQEQIVELLADLRARIGLSMLYVTHDLGLLAEIADRVGVMYAGHMVEIAPTEALFSHPRHPYTRGLIASIPLLSDRPKPVGQRLRGMLRRSEIPPGCPFYPRCDFARPEHAETPQHLEPVGPGHFVACQRWRELPAPSLAVERTGTGRALAPGEPLLAIEDLALTYSTGGWLTRLLHATPPIVVRDISFTMAPGETFALVGESGSGKSTIARAISGLLTPVTGRILFQGKPLPARVRDRTPEQRRQIQYIFQNPDASLNPRRTIGATLARPLEMFLRLGRAEVRQRVAAALADVRLDASYARRYPDQLSGGERQRVAIARALACDPVLLLCDEILSALDVSVQASVLELLKQLREEHNVAMLFIAHDLAVVRSLADRVGVLFRGNLFEIGATPEVFAPPFHPYTHELLMAAPGQKQRRAGTGLSRFVRVAGAAPEKGCAYAPRCPWKLGPVCDQEAPPWQNAGGTLRIRCHRSIEDLRARAVWRADAGSLVMENAEPAAV